MRCPRCKTPNLDNKAARYCPTEPCPVCKFVFRDEQSMVAYCTEYEARWNRAKQKLMRERAGQRFSMFDITREADFLEN